MKIFVKNLSIISAIILGFSSCVDFLNQTPDAIAYSDNEVFTDYPKSQQFINQLMAPYCYFDDNDVINSNVSTYSGKYHGKQMYGLRERMTDNCLCNPQYSWIPLVYYRDGNTWDNRGTYWSEDSQLRWETIWKAIRVANLSIKNVDRIENVTKVQKDKILGMAYFLRAHFYFMLLQGWGGMPYVTEPLNPAQDLDLPRDSYVLTAQKIAKDFDSAAAHLPLVIPDAEWGRPSKMGAIAYKAKALIWAASPFANPDNKQTLWEDAAIACGQAIQLAEGSGYYKLVPLDNFKKLFVDCDGETLKEVLFGRSFNNTPFWFAPYYCAIKSTEFGSGQFGAESVTENLAQCYPWSNGESIDPKTDEYKHNPYNGDGTQHTGRDPRFYQTLLYNGAVTPQVSATGRTVQIWNKSFDNVQAKELLTSNGSVVNGYTQTGYYNWKLFSNAFITTGAKTNVMWNYVRLADVYLYYAEAANRAWGANATPPQDKLPGFSLSAVNTLNKVRERANMPDYDNASPNAWLHLGTVEEFEQKVRNESRIETAFEEKRFYDLRRWRIMLDPNVLTMYGMYIEKTAAGKFIYTVTPLSSSLNLKWSDRFYLFYIKNSDTYLGHNFVQNPGW